MSGIAYQNVGGLTPGRTRFDWHKSKKCDINFGQLIPIFKKECYPGDTINIHNDILVRALPLINPTMHEITIDTHYFFVPTRLLDDTNSRPGCGNPKGDPLLLNGSQPPATRFNFELYITGGFDGEDNQEYPRWIPSGSSFTRPQDKIALQVPAPYQYSLWDYFDYPILPDGTQWASSESPVDDCRRAYNFIYNEYYRDETLVDPIPWTNEYILLRAWRKDYFTSALPFQQRGLTPALPVDISGTLNAVFNNIANNTTPSSNLSYLLGVGTNVIGAVSNSNATINSIINTPTTGAPTLSTSPNAGLQVKSLFENNTIDASNLIASTFTVSDLREVVQLQKYLERNARAGVRLSEHVKAHWGRNMRDERIGRPEYIGGTKQPFIISEVLQTSQTTNDSPLATMGGHGIAAHGDFVGSYTCEEWGWVIGIMSIMPAPAYHQGIPRNELKKTRLDWLNPSFVNLSEQDIMQAEIYIANNSTDSKLWGYQGIFDELRTEYSTVNGAFHNSLSDWHLTRHFTEAPNLNKEFIEVNPIPLQRIFAQQVSPNLLCEIDHNFYMIRPLPEIAEPGLVDHH